MKQNIVCSEFTQEQRYTDRQRYFAAFRCGDNVVCKVIFARDSSPDRMAAELKKIALEAFRDHASKAAGKDWDRVCEFPRGKAKDLDEERLAEVYMGANLDRFPWFKGAPT